MLSILTITVRAHRSVRTVMYLCLNLLLCYFHVFCVGEHSYIFGLKILCFTSIVVFKAITLCVLKRKTHLQSVEL